MEIKEVTYLENDIHVCNSPELEWLKRQDEAIIVLFVGRLWDLKKKCLVEVQDGN